MANRAPGDVRRLALFPPNDMCDVKLAKLTRLVTQARRSKADEATENHVQRTLPLSARSFLPLQSTPLAPDFALRPLEISGLMLETLGRMMTLLGG